jgi:hypothetical protein
MIMVFPSDARTYPPTVNDRVQTGPALDKIGRGDTLPNKTTEETRP